MSEDPFTNGMYRFVVNKGLDATVEDAWDWYKKRRLSGESHEVLLNHIVEVSRQCDGIVSGLFPDQKPFYSSMMSDRIALLEDSIEKSAPR